MAVGASLGLLAITSSSSDDFEEAGQTGVEARCAPNEVRDPDLEARGAKGVNQTYREIQADTIGCNPICATWEYYDPGRAATGSGGPEGNGGIYSTDTGCFAPCYWSYTYGRGTWRPGPHHVKSDDSSLQYFDDNRAPEVRQIRLGVNYRRSTTDPSTDAANLKSDSNPSGTFVPVQRQDLAFPTFVKNKDGKHYIQTRYQATGRDAGAGSQSAPGTPMTPALTAFLPTVFEPNFRSHSPSKDPAEVDGQGPIDRNGRSWEDENWEYRADPVKKECTIVNLHPNPGDDPLVCSSEWDDCASRS